MGKALLCHIIYYYEFSEGAGGGLQTQSLINAQAFQSNVYVQEAQQGGYPKGVEIERGTPLYPRHKKLLGPEGEGVIGENERVQTDCPTEETKGVISQKQEEFRKGREGEVVQV